MLQGRIIQFLVLSVTCSAAAGADLKRDKARARLMLKNISKTIEKNFYDPSLLNLDWEGLRKETESRIDQAQSVSQIFTILSSFVRNLDDSHTIFIPPSRVSKPRFGFEAKAFGEVIRIFELSPEGAASRSGLQKGDRLLTINGFNAERSSFQQMMLFFRLLNPVTVMEIAYQRGEAPVATIRLEADIEQGLAVTDLTKVETIYDMIRESQNERQIFRYRMDEEVGFLQIPSFTASKRFLNKLFGRVKEAKVLIVDLRGNLGGAVEGLRNIAGYFESESVMLAEMRGRKKAEPLKANPSKPLLQVPLVILVDSESASAAEVFARHFQRTGRAVVVGDRTSGQVSVGKVFMHQMGMGIVVLYGVQVTVARLVFPDGEEIEGRGIVPDKHCLPAEEDLRQGRDPCLELGKELALESLGSRGS